MTKKHMIWIEGAYISCTSTKKDTAGVKLKNIYETNTIRTKQAKQGRIYVNNLLLNQNNQAN